MKSKYEVKDCIKQLRTSKKDIYKYYKGQPIQKYLELATIEIQINTLKWVLK